MRLVMLVLTWFAFQVQSVTASPSSGSEQSSYSTFFLTKNDNEYFLINKKAKTDDTPPNSQPG